VSELTGSGDSRGLAFSPDGKRIVTGGYGHAKAWDVEKGGLPLFELKGITDVAGCISPSHS
jgi:WD40 repeat protein